MAEFWGGFELNKLLRYIFLQKHSNFNYFLWKHREKQSDSFRWNLFSSHSKNDFPLKATALLALARCGAVSVTHLWSQKHFQFKIGFQICIQGYSLRKSPHLEYSQKGTLNRCSGPYEPLPNPHWHFNPKTFFFFPKFHNVFFFILRAPSLKKWILRMCIQACVCMLCVFLCYIRA